MAIWWPWVISGLHVREVQWLWRRWAACGELWVSCEDMRAAWWWWEGGYNCTYVFGHPITLVLQALSTLAFLPLNLPRVELQLLVFQNVFIGSATLTGMRGDASQQPTRTELLLILFFTMLTSQDECVNFQESN